MGTASSLGRSHEASPTEPVLRRRIQVSGDDELCPGKLLAGPTGDASEDSGPDWHQDDTAIPGGDRDQRGRFSGAYDAGERSSAADGSVVHDTLRIRAW